MSKPLPADRLRALEPRYTINGLFQSGQLDSADETALEEIRALREAFHRFVNPSRGWMTPRYGNSAPAAPRQLGNGPAWRRYKTWRARHRQQIVPPSPGTPWGLTVADLVVALATEPRTFADMAALAERPAIELVELFVCSVRDYGREVYQAKQQFWRAWNRIDADMAQAKKRRQLEKTAERVRRHRARQRM